MKKIISNIIALVVGVLILFIWSFTRSGYSTSAYFKPTIIASLFFIVGFVIRIPNLKLSKVNIFLLLLPSVILIGLTFYSHKALFLFDLPLLPFWATLSAFIGYKSFDKKLIKPLIIFIVFVGFSSFIYAKNISSWSLYASKLNSKKTPKNIYENIEHSLLTKDSTYTKIDNLKGKIILIEFYRNGCAPCIKQLPILTELQANFNREDFEVILLNTGRVDSYKQAFTNKHFSNKGIKILYDVDGKLTSHLNIKGIPQQFLLDKKGRVVSHIIGSPSSISGKTKLENYIKLISKELKN